MTEEPVLRWILRVLGDDALMPIYLSDVKSKKRFRLAIENAFWGISSDYEHPASARERAWAELEQLIDGIDSDHPVPAFYGRVVALLRSTCVRSEHIRMVRCWAWPEIASAANQASPLNSYHEIHAHFRGSVPIDWLWLSLMTDARARARLRNKACVVGRWTRTRAELAETASKLRLTLQPSSVQEKEGNLRKACMERRDLVAVRYLALQANFRRFLLHQRGRTGLVSFTKSFDATSKLIKRGTRGRALRQLDRGAVVATLQRFEESGATVVELRPTLDAVHRSNVEKLKTIVLGYFDYLGTATKAVALGLVPSLFKQEVIDRGGFHGCAQDEGLRERLIQQQHVWKRQVESLLEAIRAVPLLRMFVVGIDAAGLEMGAPVRALAPAFALIHDHHRKWNLVDCPRKREIPVQSLKERLLRIREDHPSDQVASDVLWESFDGANSAFPVERRRLGLTVHAGEDFIDPTTGLREIWEAVEHLGLGEYDRIGHAIALSLDGDSLRELLRRRGESKEVTTVEAVRSNRWRLRKPAGVHALDLAWSSSLRSCRERAELAHAVSRAIGVLPMHGAVYEALSNGAFPASVLIPGVCFRDDDTKPLEAEHWCWVEVDEAWCTRFEELRQIVISKIRRTGIVIESCPTSNCAVANLEKPPILGLLAIDPKIDCAVATDDPGVLDAWPEHELAYLDQPARVRVLRINEKATFVRRR